MKKQIISLALMSSLVMVTALPLNAVSQNAKAQKITSWAIVQNQSGISWTAVHIGKPVSGAFAIDARTSIINFDANNLGASNVSINIPINSLNTKSNDARDNLPLNDWFALKTHPNAIYQANSFKALGNGRYLASGFLIIKGVRFNLPLNFSLSFKGNQAIMDAQTTLDRVNLKLGLDSDAKAEWVDRNVKVNIRLIANKK